MVQGKVAFGLDGEGVFPQLDTGEWAAMQAAVYAGTARAQQLVASQFALNTSVEEQDETIAASVGQGAVGAALALEVVLTQARAALALEALLSVKVLNSLQDKELKAFEESSKKKAEAAEKRKKEMEAAGKKFSSGGDKKKKGKEKAEKTPGLSLGKV